MRSSTGGASSRGTSRYRRAWRKMAVVPKKDFLSTTRSTQWITMNYDITDGWQNTAQGRVFRLEDLPENSEFSALFDAYRITKVDLTFIPSGNVSDIGNTYADASQLPNQIPTLYIAPDYDNAPASPDARNLLERGNMKMLYLDKPRTFSVVPKVSTNVYNGATGVGYAEAKPKQWIDCAYPGVDHNGVVWFLNNTSVPKGWRCDIFAKFHLEFKQVI